MHQEIVDCDGKPLVAGRYYKDGTVGYVYLACKTGRNSEPNNITLFLAYPITSAMLGHRFNMGRADLIKTFCQVPNLVPIV